MTRLSDGCFHGIRERRCLAYGVPTSQAHETAKQARESAVHLSRFLRGNSMARPCKISNPGGVGQFHHRLVFNVDQILLPLRFSKGRN
jgi:hypothetical protein